jgi:SAM-dependent methyltransferase
MYRHALLPLLGLALVTPAPAAGPPRLARLKVLLPDDDAQLIVNGVPVPDDSGRTRLFTAPPGSTKKGVELTAAWDANNYTRFLRDARVFPRPDRTTVVDLRKPNPKRPDRIEIRFVPTPNDVVRRMCKLGRVTKDDVVYDLGCGDGRMVLLAVKEFGAKRGVGVDLDPQRVGESKENARRMGLSKKVEFRVGDVLKIKDLKDASVVLLYMGDDVNLRLRPVLLKTLKPGSRIVSHRFKMGDWKPDKTETFRGADGNEYEIHLWTVPKKK